MRQRAGGVLLVVAVLGVGACGGDEAKASLADYCQRAATLEEKGRAFFADFNPENQSAVDQAFVAFAQALEADAKAALAAAPDEIREDVALMVEALDRTADGDIAAFTSVEAQAAGSRIDDFEKEKCQTG